MLGCVGSPYTIECSYAAKNFGLIVFYHVIRDGPRGWSVWLNRLSDLNGDIARNCCYLYFPAAQGVICCKFFPVVLGLDSRVQSVRQRG